ncbi:phosphoanhydride phosphohydrolase [Asaia krungthepensis NRIC 0535]|uniref:Phosphoanhydride phosphohydrolase n=1 Tax=Asaia krungthepensis NRIC 0535 TaxID=1307925 RepID=A0ABQ0Q1S4_9PROT|nr:phosphoanhydride phosphohydrolase [Asaia krungthepensis NRIC 0535]
MPAGEHDPLFDGVPEGYVSAHKRVLYDDAASAGAFDASHRPDTVQSGLRALQALIVPQGCDSEKGPCFIRPLTIGEKKGRPVIDGGPAGAASLAENLLLIHVEGLDRDATRWVGRIDEKILSAVLPVHGYMAQLTRRRGALVEQKAHQLVGVLEDFLDGNEVTLPDETTVGRDIRFLAFAGHDTTLDALAAHYGLDWHFDDQPDETAPDTTLAFERWRSPEGRITIRVRLFHQSLAALRQGKGLDLDHGGQILLEPRHQ